MRLVRFAVLAAVALIIGMPVVTQAQAAKPKAVGHDLEGKAQCLMCHGGAMPNIPAAPENHAERPNETCLWCHGPGAAMLTEDAKGIAHDLEGKAQCQMCHSGAMPNIPAPPEDHEGRGNEYCTLCHSPPS